MLTTFPGCSVWWKGSGELVAGGWPLTWTLSGAAAGGSGRSYQEWGSEPGPSLSPQLTGKLPNFSGGDQDKSLSSLTRWGQSPMTPPPPSARSKGIYLNKNLLLDQPTLHNIIFFSPPRGRNSHSLLAFLAIYSPRNLLSLCFSIYETNKSMFSTWQELDECESIWMTYWLTRTWKVWSSVQVIQKKKCPREN